MMRIEHDLRSVQNKSATNCQNCDKPIGNVGILSKTVVVCSDACVNGWLNGESAKDYLKTAAKLKALIAN